MRELEKKTKAALLKLLDELEQDGYYAWRTEARNATAEMLCGVLRTISEIGRQAPEHDKCD